MVRKKEAGIIEKYKVLTETSPDCIKLFDTKGNLLYINPGGLKEHGLGSLEEAIEKKWNIAESVVDKDIPIVKKALEDAIKKGVVSSIEIEHKKETSDRDFCLETIAPVKDSKGNIVGIFGVSRDISNLKKIEEELEKSKEILEEEVKKRTAELKEKLEELERINKMMVGRELKMIELKEKLEELETKN